MYGDLHRIGLRAERQGQVGSRALVCPTAGGGSVLEHYIWLVHGRLHTGWRQAAIFAVHSRASDYMAAVQLLTDGVLQ